MTVTVVKHKFKGRNYTEVIKIFTKPELAKRFIDINKNDSKFNGEWSLSDRIIHDSI